MDRVWTTHIGEHTGERVRVAGWLHRMRQLSNVSFLVLRDGKGTAQIVVDDQALATELSKLHAESVLQVEGTVVASPQAPGGVELHDPAVEVVSRAVAPPPFDLFRPTIRAQLPTILDHAAVSLRHPRHRAYFRLEAAAMAGFRQTLDRLDFVEIQTPKLVASATEGGANVFKVDYFGRAAYLAQSPQLYKQTMVGVYERVYEVGPAFRAEPHDTPRHLNEFVSLDVELGFIQDHTTVMDLLTEVVAGMVGRVRDEEAEAVAFLGIALPPEPRTIPSVHFSDAMTMLADEFGDPVRSETDLAPAHERWLGEWAQREHGSEFLFVVGFPMVKRPFYTHPDPQRPEYSRSFDLLFRGIEVVTGGQRLHLYEDYLSALDCRNQPSEPLEGYLEAFKHGMPPHGGFALGVERFVARLVGAANVREAVPFPRDINRLTP
jgi:nondiscriminating aspartyl-tRNA synthetase